MGASAADAFSFHHDVQPPELSEFQSHYLAHDAITSAVCRNHSHYVLHRLELRMDAGSFVSDLSPLRIPTPMGLETLAARDRRRDWGRRRERRSRRIVGQLRKRSRAGRAAWHSFYSGGL